MNMTKYIFTITNFTYNLLGHLQCYTAAVQQLKPLSWDLE
jgi:hypothetical protein